MADKRITELPDGTTAAATDVVPIVRAGENYKLALSGLTTAADTQILFKDGTLVAGSADFVFDKTLKTLALTGKLTATANATGTVPLVAKAFAGQTANLQEWQNSSGTPQSFIRKDGAAQFGPTAQYIAATAGLDQALAARFTQDQAFSSGRGIYSEVHHTPSSGASNIVYGIQTTVYGNASGTSTSNYVTGIYGLARSMSSRPYAQVTGLSVFAPYISGGTGVVSIGTGVQTQSYLDATAVCTTIYGINVAAPSTLAGYSLTNLYGIYVAKQSQASTLNYALYTAGGRVKFVTGGDAVIGLSIQGTAAQSANLQEWQNSAGTALVAVGATGDVLFAGAGTGLPYGAMYGTELTQSQVLAQNTWYPVNDAAISDGTGGLNLVTHDGAGKLTATNAGRYLLSYSLTSEMNANNKHIELGYMINGTAGLDGQAHTESITNQEIALSASAIVVLTAGQYVQVCFRTTNDGGPTLLVDDVNLTMVGLGG